MIICFCLSLIQALLDFSQQLLRLNGTKDEAHRAQAETFSLVLLSPDGRTEKNEGDLAQQGIRLDAHDEHETILPGHVKVGENEIRRNFPGEHQSFLRIGCKDDFIAKRLESAADHFPVNVRVIYNEDTGHFESSSLLLLKGI